MNLKEEEKEKLKKDIQHPDNERQKREYMDAEQKKEFEKRSSTNKEADPEDELKSRDEFRDQKNKKK